MNVVSPHIYTVYAEYSYGIVGRNIFATVHHTIDVWRSGGIGPRVINLWHDMDVCVELRAQVPVPPSESALPTPAG